MTRGEYMRRARRNAELTIKQLAALSGVSANAIGGLERGKRISGQYMTIEVLADALGLSVDEYTGHRIVQAALPVRCATASYALRHR